MNHYQTLIARRLFQLRVYKADGMAYQRLFEEVMRYHEPGFVTIKPHGKEGDRKNDGYRPSTGTYYQVYSPEKPETVRSEVAAAKKAKDDFDGLRKAWDDVHPIQEYRFAFNDKYHGLPVPVTDALAAIEKANGIRARPFLAGDLENAALELETAQVFALAQMVIPADEAMDDVDFGVLGEVIQHVLEAHVPLALGAVLTAPDFFEKVTFNGLSRSIATLLHYGSFQSEAIEEFFSRNSDYAKQQVRDQLAAMYAQSRESLEEATAGAPHVSDLVFFDLLEQVMPIVEGTAPREARRLQEAALVVLAFYFEACDIFEDPSASS